MLRMKSNVSSKQASGQEPDRMDKKGKIITIPHHLLTDIFNLGAASSQAE